MGNMIVNHLMFADDVCAFGPIIRDGFTHRPWPRAPRFWGPRATIFSMMTQC